MRRILGCVVVVLCLATTSVAQAQAEEQRPIRVGVGAAVNLGSLTFLDDGSLNFLPLGLAGLVVPIRFSGTFMLEPEIGLFILSREQNYAQDDATYNSSTTAVRLGLGALYLIDLAEATNASVGLRGGAILVSGDDESDEGAGVETRESSQTSFFIGLSVGGEYYLSPSFSLGAQVDLNLMFVGDEETTVNGNADPGQADDTQTVFSTSTLLVVRWFFL